MSPSKMSPSITFDRAVDCSTLRNRGGWGAPGDQMHAARTPAVGAATQQIQTARLTGADDSEHAGAAALATARAHSVCR